MLFNSKEQATQSVIAAEKSHSLAVYKVAANQQDNYKDNEVWVNGKLYDVAERKIIKDTLYLSLYHDSDEESILSVITNFFNPDEKSFSSLSQNGPLLKSIRAIPNPVYTLDISHFRLISYATGYLRFLKNPDNVPLIYSDITSPSPRLS